MHSKIFFAMNDNVSQKFYKHFEMYHITKDVNELKEAKQWLRSKYNNAYITRYFLFNESITYSDSRYMMNELIVHSNGKKVRNVYEFIRFYITYDTLYDFFADCLTKTHNVNVTSDDACKYIAKSCKYIIGITGHNIDVVVHTFLNIITKLQNIDDVKCRLCGNVVNDHKLRPTNNTSDTPICDVLWDKINDVKKYM